MPGSPKGFAGSGAGEDVAAANDYHGPGLVDPPDRVTIEKLAELIEGTCNQAHT